MPCDTRTLLRTLLVLTATVVLCSSSLPAQSTAQPGKFDFYLLDLPWGPEFCHIADVSAGCKPPRGFVVHGLWPQNNDGSYPVFCSGEPGPSRPERNLDITPDLKLLDHEWAKHGTCSNVGPARFFANERQARRSIKIPTAFEHVDHEIEMAPEQILSLFYKENRDLPHGSVVVSCHEGRLTAVEACFTKATTPMRCRGIRSCDQKTIRIRPDARK